MPRLFGSRRASETKKSEQPVQLSPGLLITTDQPQLESRRSPSPSPLETDMMEKRAKEQSDLIATLNGEAAERQQRITSLTEKLHAAWQQIEQLEARNKAHCETIDDLQSKIEAARQAESVGASSKSTADYQPKSETSTAEKQVNEQQHDTQLQDNTSGAADKLAIARAAAENKALVTENAQLTARIESLESSQKELLETIDQNKKQIADLMDRAKRAEKSLSEAAEANQQATQRSEAAEASLISSKKALDQQRCAAEELERENAKLAQSLQEANAKLESSLIRLQKSEITVETLTKKISELNQASSATTAAADEAKEAVSKLQTEKIVTLSMEVRQLQSLLDAEREKVEIQTKELATVKEHVVELEGIRAHAIHSVTQIQDEKIRSERRVSTLKLDLWERDMQIDSLKKALEDSKTGTPRGSAAGVSITGNRQAAIGTGSSDSAVGARQEPERDEVVILQSQLNQEIERSLKVENEVVRICQLLERLEECLPSEARKHLEQMALGAPESNIFPSAQNIIALIDSVISVVRNLSQKPVATSSDVPSSTSQKILPAPASLEMTQALIMQDIMHGILGIRSKFGHVSIDKDQFHHLRIGYTLSLVSLFTIILNIESSSNRQDATVEHVRKQLDPDNVFSLPHVPIPVPDLPLAKAIAKMQQDLRRWQEREIRRHEMKHAITAGLSPNRPNDGSGGSLAPAIAAESPFVVTSRPAGQTSPASPAKVDIAGTAQPNAAQDQAAAAGAAQTLREKHAVTFTTINDTQFENEEAIGLCPLHIAARDNKVRDIKQWLQSYSKNALDNRDFTPLMVAASHNSVRALTFLLRLGVRKDDVDCKTRRTALHWAVYHGHTQATYALLRNGADARFRDREGRTPVHLAAIHPRAKCLKMILKFVKPEALLEGDNELMTPFHLAVMSDNVKHLKIMLSVRPPIDFTAVDVEGKTALHWCTQNTEPQTYTRSIFHKPATCAKLLIENQPELVSIRDLEGRTPLHLCCSNSNTPLIFELCNQMYFGTQDLKAMVDARDVLGRTAMHYSAISGHAYILRILRHHGGDDGLADKDGATPLHYACAKNHGQCVTVLISDNRLYNNYTRDNQGRTPIMWAVLKGYSEALRILLEAGVNPSEEDDKRTTVGEADLLQALHICAMGGHTHCATLLLEHGAVVDSRNAEEKSALFFAVQFGHGDTCNTLIQHGADVNLLDPDKRSPLHWAALCGHLSVVSLLISCEADLEIADAEGKTPVHCAAYNGHAEVLSFLIKNGARADHKDFEGVSALHWATCGNHVDCVTLLIQMGVNPNIMDSDYLTPMDYAISMRSYESVDILKEHGGQTGEIIGDVYANRIQKFWRSARSRTLFPSRPSLIKATSSRPAPPQINVTSKYDQLEEDPDESDDDNGNRAKTGSMSSFEMEYFKIEAERRRAEERG
eukprot:jgi/Hompol1/5335/HPOL_001945-RA